MRPHGTHWEGLRLRMGPPPAMFVWEVADDDDYGEVTRRMIVVAPTAEAAEALWDDPHTEHRTFARPVLLKGREMKIPGGPRVLHRQRLAPDRADMVAA